MKQQRCVSCGLVSPETLSECPRCHGDQFITIIELNRSTDYSYEDDPQYTTQCKLVPEYSSQVSCDTEDPMAIQEGGSHYKSYAIQPAEFIHKNNIPWCVGNAIKYVCRHRDKGGLEDLKKAKHYIDMIIAMEYQ